jgi:acyl carrier protein
MEEKLKNVMANVFSIEVSEIEALSSPDTIVQWDSIGHLNLITAIEEEFNVFFDEEEIIQMLNFQLVLAITKEALEKGK